MRIAVLSDTHDRLPDHVVANIRGADEIWHLGDVIAPAIIERLHALGRPLRVVRGNCDDCPDWPQALEFVLCGVRFFLLHIPPRVPPPKIDVLLHGHTHVPRDEVVQGVRMLNPGCITRPNRGAPASYAWLHVEDGAVLSWEIVRV
jgi:putative phosphoesterase